eukprot:jgi/Ulvmu1/12604/UM092_0034.1
MFNGYRPRVSTQCRNSYTGCTPIQAKDRSGCGSPAENFEDGHFLTQPPPHSASNESKQAGSKLSALAGTHTSTLTDSSALMSWKVQAAYELSKLFLGLGSLAAAEELAESIASRAVFEALADALLQASSCAAVLLGLLAQLTFSSAAVATLKRTEEGNGKLQGALCGMFRALRSLPQPVAATLVQVCANIANTRGGITWLSTAGITSAAALRLAHALCCQLPNTVRHGHHTAAAQAQQACSAGPNNVQACPVGADATDEKRSRRPPQRARVVESGGGRSEAPEQETNVPLVAQAGVTTGETGRVLAQLKQVALLLADSAFGRTAIQQNPSLQALLEDLRSVAI